jgi:hypothetical protein
MATKATEAFGDSKLGGDDAVGKLLFPCVGRYAFEEADRSYGALVLEFNRGQAVPNREKENVEALLSRDS